MKVARTSIDDPLLQDFFSGFFNVNMTVEVNVSVSYDFVNYVVQRVAVGIDGLDTGAKYKKSYQYHSVSFYVMAILDVMFNFRNHFRYICDLSGNFKCMF